MDWGFIGGFLKKLEFNQEVTIQALLNRIAPQANIETRHDINGNMRMIRVWDLLESQAK